MLPLPRLSIHHPTHLWVGFFHLGCWQGQNFAGVGTVRLKGAEPEEHWWRHWIQQHELRCSLSVTDCLEYQLLSIDAYTRWTHFYNGIVSNSVWLSHTTWINAVSVSKFVLLLCPCIWTNSRPVSKSTLHLVQWSIN